MSPSRRPSSAREDSVVLAANAREEATIGGAAAFSSHIKSTKVTRRQIGRLQVEPEQMTKGQCGPVGAHVRMHVAALSASAFYSHTFGSFSVRVRGALTLADSSTLRKPMLNGTSAGRQTRNPVGGERLGLREREEGKLGAGSDPQHQQLH